MGQFAVSQEYGMWLAAFSPAAEMLDTEPDSEIPQYNDML